MIDYGMAYISRRSINCYVAFPEDTSRRKSHRTLTKAKQYVRDNLNVTDRHYPKMANSDIEIYWDRLSQEQTKHLYLHKGKHGNIIGIQVRIGERGVSSKYIPILPKGLYEAYMRACKERDAMLDGSVITARTKGDKTMDIVDYGMYGIVIVSPGVYEARIPGGIPQMHNSLGNAKLYVRECIIANSTSDKTLHNNAIEEEWAKLTVDDKRNIYLVKTATRIVRIRIQVIINKCTVSKYVSLFDYGLEEAIVKATELRGILKADKEYKRVKAMSTGEINLVPKYIRPTVDNKYIVFERTDKECIFEEITDANAYALCHLGKDELWNAIVGNAVVGMFWDSQTEDDKRNITLLPNDDGRYMGFKVAVMIEGKTEVAFFSLLKSGGVVSAFNEAVERRNLLRLPFTTGEKPKYRTLTEES